MQKTVLGLTCEPSFIKTALLREEKGCIVLDSLNFFFNTEDCVKQLYTSFPLSPSIATALPAQEVLFRHLSLPIHRRKQALAALPFQLEEILPFPVEEANIAAHLDPIGKKAFNVSLFAARDSSLEAQLQWAQSLHIDLDSISCVPNALYRLCQWLFPQEKTFSIFYIGETQSCCVIVNDNQLSLSQTLSFGHQDFLQALALDFPEKSLESLKQDPLYRAPSGLVNLDSARQSQIEAAEGNKRDHCLNSKASEEDRFGKVAASPNSPNLTERCTKGPLIHFTQVQQRVHKEMQRFFYFLNNKNIPTNDWIVLGDVYPALPSSLYWTGETPRHLENLAVATPLLHEYAIPIGAALDALIGDHHSVQFLQGKWTLPRHQKKRKKRAIQFAALSLSAALIMGLGGHALLQKKEQILSQQLLGYVPPTLANAMSQGPIEWEEALWQWESSLDTKKLPFPFIPTVPSVSDVLAWLSAHPVLSSSEGGKKEGIDIKNVRYQLYKYPKLGESGGLYAAKLELEITTSTPRLAREFHDSLLKGDQIVNAKKEIKWNSQQNTYWTSFELNPLKKRAQ